MRILRAVRLAFFPYIGFIIVFAYHEPSHSPATHSIELLEKIPKISVRDYPGIDSLVLTRDASPHQLYPDRLLYPNPLLQRDTDHLSLLFKRALSPNEVETNIREWTHRAEVLEQSSQGLHHFGAIKEVAKKVNKADLSAALEQLERMMATTVHRGATGNLPPNESFRQGVLAEVAQLRAARRRREASRLEAAMERLIAAREEALTVMQAARRETGSQSPDSSPGKHGGGRGPPAGGGGGGGGGGGSPLRKGFLLN